MYAVFGAPPPAPPAPARAIVTTIRRRPVAETERGRGGLIRVAVVPLVSSLPHPIVLLVLGRWLVVAPVLVVTRCFRFRADADAEDGRELTEGHED